VAISYITGELMIKRRILLCSQWVERYQSLVEGLLQTGRFEIFCEQTYIDKMGSDNPDLKSYEPHLPAWNAPELEREADRRIKPIADHLLKSAKQSITDFESYRVFDQPDSLIAGLKNPLAGILYMHGAFEQMARTIKPDLLITDGRGIKQQSWVTAAKRLNIPSLEIYHAMLSLKTGLILHGHDQADFFAVGSELIKKLQIQQGIPEERIRITGLHSAPGNDLSKEEAVKLLAEKYGLDPKRKIVLLFNHYECGDALEFLFNLAEGCQVDLTRQLCAVVTKINSSAEHGVQLIIKRHPTIATAGCDDEDAYRHIAAQENLKPIMVSPHESNPLLLAAADVVINFMVSSTVSEALNADKPVVLGPCSRDWLHDEILNSGAIIPFDNQNSLENALDRCLNDQVFQEKIALKRQNYLQRYPHVDVKNVIEYIIEYIDDIVEGNGIRMTKVQDTNMDNRVMMKKNYESKPTSILHITDCLSKGGAGRALIGAAKYSRQQGNFQHECISLKPLFDGVVAENVTEGLKVHVAPDINLIRSLVEAANVVHWHWWEDIPLMRENLPKKPNVVWCAVSGEYPPHELTREVVDFADIMVITNPMTRDLPAIRSLSEEERQNKVRLIFESADFDRILPIGKIPHDTFNVGWIGTIAKGKYNPRYVEMSSRISIPNVRFMICGEGPLKETAIKEVSRFGAEEQFQFLGYQDNMRKMFGLFDVYGFPLDEETFAGGELNLQEAMVAGLPIVILPFGGPKRMILHNYNGLIAYSEKEYKEHIEYLYHHPEERERLGNNARDYAMREFGAHRAAEKFNVIYSELTESASQRVEISADKSVGRTPDLDSLKRLALHHQGKMNTDKAIEYAAQYLKVKPNDAEMLRIITRRKAAADNINDIAASESDEIEKRIDTRAFDSYKVTALVSTYKSEEHFLGGLLDLFEQTLYKKGELEIIVIDSASPEREWYSVEEYTKDHKHVLAIRTKERESLYAAWNRAIRLARGEYLTSANTDDRHRKDALDVLARTLDEHPDVAIAYADSLKTDKPGEIFDHNSAVDAFRWGEYSQEKLEHHCCVGPQPVWRKKLHEEIGFFDEQYQSAADYDFWLRVSEKYTMYHVNQILGLYLDNPESLEHNGLLSNYERIDILNRHHLRKLPQVKDKPLVSVIIPTYNRVHLLKSAVDSLIRQTYRHWEAIVINDGAAPLNFRENELPADDRIQIINLPENHERSYCRNLGIREARGKYIAFLDDDDAFYRHHLELFVRTFEEQKGKYKIIYSDSNKAIGVNQNGEAAIARVELAYSEEYDPDRLYIQNYIPILSLVCDREVFSDGQLFDEELNELEDYDLLVRLSMKYDFYHLKQITHEFREFEALTTDEVKRHRDNYRKIFTRYQSHLQGKEEIVLKQQKFLSELEKLINQKETEKPSFIPPLETANSKKKLQEAIA